MHNGVELPALGGQAAESPVELRARLASDLQDLVAESRFGWSRLREHREP